MSAGMWLCLLGGGLCGWGFAAAQEGDKNHWAYSVLGAVILIAGFIIP